MLKLKWEKICWLNITPGVTSFPWPGLPDDVHFSISYNANSDMMNLHLSRNVQGVPPEDKPYIRIAQWPKAEMEEMVQIFFSRYWKHVWTPFDMARYQYRPTAKGQAARYCSITRLLKPGKEHTVHRQLKAQLLRHTDRKKKGKLLVFRHELIPALEDWILRPDIFWGWMDQFKRVPRKFSLTNELGYLHGKDFSGLVMQVQGQWFAYRKDADLSTIFQAFFEPDVYDDLEEKVTDAIVNISEARMKDDTLPYNRPIDLAIIR